MRLRKSEVLENRYDWAIEARSQLRIVLEGSHGFDVTYSDRKLISIYI